MFDEMSLSILKDENPQGREKAIFTVFCLTHFIPLISFDTP